MKKSDFLKIIEGHLIVSCQARLGWPMYGEKIMAAFAEAAKLGGAVAIRANGASNIREIKNKVDLPVLGINKIWIEKESVYITPTFDSAVEIIEAGVEAIALDGTRRKRPNNEKLEDIICKIKTKYPEMIIMGDCATVEDALYSEKCGVDIVSTTLYGYTEETKGNSEINYDLIKDISSKVKIPLIAEGHVNTGEVAKKCIENGALSVVVGTAITRPEIITKNFVEEINKI